MIRALASLAVLLLASLALAMPIAFAQEPPPQDEAITVVGRVVNGTRGGDPVEGLTVVFHHNTEEQLNEIPATLGPDGSFAFEGVLYDPDTAYGVSVVYKGALYGLDLNLSQGLSGPVVLTIYETIRSDEILRAELVSVLISQADPGSESVWVLEIVRLVNDSDLAYVPGPEPMQIIRFGLPEGANGLRVDTSLIAADVFQVDRGFGVSASVPPGVHEVLYSYQFPYSGSTQEMVRNLRYGADLLRVVVPTSVAGLANPSIGTLDLIEIGEQPYFVLEVTDVAKGVELSLTLTDLPVPTLVDRFNRNFDSIRWEMAAPVALGVLVAMAAGFVLWRNRRTGSWFGPGGGPPLDERVLVLEMVAELDASRRDGSLSEEEYRRRRSVLTNRLAALREKAPDP